MRAAGAWLTAIAAAVVALPAALAGGHGADEVPEGHNATLLTVQSFDAYIKNQQTEQRACLVMFHVSWCKVCQRTFPKFAAASDLVAEQEIPMSFAHVDCTADKSLCQRFAVKGYPTIKLIPPQADAENATYRNQRSEQSFVKYAERMTQPAVRRFKGAAQLEKALRNETFAGFVAVGDRDEGSYQAGLVAAAGSWRDRHIFAIAPSLRDILPGPLASSAPRDASLAVLSLGAQQWRGADNNTEPAPVAAFYKGSLDDDAAVNAWVKMNRFPGIWVLDEGNFYDFSHASRRACIIAVDPAKVTREQEKELRTTAGKLSKDMIFGVLDGVAWAEELMDLNVAKGDLPRVLVTEDDFERWIEDIDKLRLETLERDLRALLDGAPLLRQGRSAMLKMQFYRREAVRYAARLSAYAQRGRPQAAAAVLIVALALLVVFGLGWFCVSCCRMLAEDPELEFRAPIDEARQKKRN